jgi:catechol-2,3-dioxygenase
MGMHIGHVALRVRDLDGYIDHITTSLGLVILDRTAEEAYLGTQGTRHELQLIKADSPAFDHVGLMVDSADQLDEIVERAIGVGGKVIEPTEETGCEQAVTIVGPGGIAHQLYVPSARPPLTPARNLSTAVRRLGHLTFFTSQVDALVKFWTEGLGFRISDEAAGFVWTRCDAYHHSLAVGPHPSSTVLHHHAWEVQDVAALAKYCDINGLAGRSQSWGPVRHGPGFNLATYMPDAAGALIEVYTDLLLIEDDTNYVPVDWSNEPRALNLWGPMPSPEAMTAGVPVEALPHRSSASSHALA